VWIAVLVLMNVDLTLSQRHEQAHFVELNGRKIYRRVSEERTLRKFSLIMFSVFFFLCYFGLSAQFLPEIRILNGTKDDIFKQFDKEKERNNEIVKSNIAQEEKVKHLNIYLYKYNPDDKLFSRKGTEQTDFILFEARTVSRDAIATLNRWDSMRDFPKGEAILLPTMEGIFIPEKPETDFEHLVAVSRQGMAEGGISGVLITVKMENGQETKFRFIPGEKLSNTERFFLLNPRRFQLPFKKFRLTSSFGLRTSPITGKPSMHGGLDLAAPFGTHVYSAAAGTVTELGDNPIYGKYVIITHNEGWTSLYGHLSYTGVSQYEEVKKGRLIGKVGSTGLSTGPHLHFEIRKDGIAQNPKNLVKTKD